MKAIPLDTEEDTEIQDNSVSESTLICEDLKKVTGNNNNNESNTTYFKNNESHSSESDNLIICSPELAASFQTLKVEKHKLNPGHYLQKVFLNGLAQKFRSQSLPNNLEKKRYQKQLGCEQEELKETSVPLVETTDGTPLNLDVKETFTDGWFKTWPERGLEKTSVSKNDAYSEEKVRSKNTFHQLDSELESRKDQHLNLNISCKISSESQFCINSSDINNSPLDSTETNNLCKVNTQPYSDNFKGKGKTIPLDKLLENFPLAYSPVTRQLHLIPQNQNPEEIEGNVNQINDEKLNQCNTYIDNLKLEQQSADKLGGGNGWVIKPTGSVTDLSGCNNSSCVNNEISSFSSTISSLSDTSPSTNEDSALGSLLDHGDTCSLVSVGGCSAFSEDSVGERSKKKSLSGFISRNVFNWNSGSRSDDSISGRGTSWKLFGKNISPVSSHTSFTVDYAESEGGSVAPDSPCSVRSSSSVAGSGAGAGPRSFTHESRVASSSALIQLDRPACLPAKSDHDTARHRLEYQQILDAARKKELKEAKHRKKQLQIQLRAEEQLALATRVWTHEILPKWDQMSSSKKCRDLWWQGVPPCVRGKVWKLAIGNHLNLTQSLYDVYVKRAQDRLQSGVSVCSEGGEEGSDNMEQIQLDISRTFPHLCIFQQGGPYYDMLHCLLAAYVCYRPDVGYVQGMSFIAAVLILNMEAADAFVCFANLLNRPCHMAFFQLNQSQMQAYYSTYNQLLKENLPQLCEHFVSTTLSPDLYLLDWIYTVFTKAMNLDLASRLWDVFLRDGDQFLFRAALGILQLCQDQLLKMDFVHGSQFLTKLPDDLSAEQLFKSITCIKMTVGKQTFQDILDCNSIDCH